MIKKKIKIFLVALSIIISVSFLSWSNLEIFGDSDNDGVRDSLDNCPITANMSQDDFDGDKIGNTCDFDDDNDKILDELDFFDDDSNEWADFDFDGVGTVKDTDDDNDGILDVQDSDQTLPSEDLTSKYIQDIQNCAKMSDGTSRLLCYTQFFDKVTENEDINSNALELAIALSKTDAMDDCHFVSHEIGHIAFKENPDVTANLSGMDGTMCRGGYFHGVLASYFHNIKENGDSFPIEYNTICDDLIGSSNYQDCIHGLGHGLVHYFDENLDSSLEQCHNMSFYQNRLCMKGVMMQYTDNVLTRDGISKSVISNICDASKLEYLDYIECSMSVGTTLAFFSNHDYDEGAKLCKIIENKNGRENCLEGLRLEINDSEKYETEPLTEEIREKFQPQFIESSSKIIDIRSPAQISNFEFIPQIGMISFSIDAPKYVIMYIPSEFVQSELLVAVNSQIPSELDITKNVSDGEVVMIRFVPDNAGIVMITSLGQ